jgi:GDP-4-dehydro-6-deoxy-D-mannose reductase
LGKYLITGAAGFVSKHLVDFLEAKEPEAEIFGIDKDPPSFPFRHGFSSVNLLDYERVAAVIAEVAPTRIVHLASFSSVAGSWAEPAISFSNNTNVFLNILEAVRRNRVACRILSIGSSEEYGDVTEDALPLSESAALAPISPYAVARVAQESLSRIYSRSFGLDIVMTRSFNHIGPGQRPDFVVPSIVGQFLRDGDAVLSMGDTSIVRDFLDVRDVVRAYHALLLHGSSGEVYNVCSGIGISIAQVVEEISDVVGKKYIIRVDREKIRPNDNRAIVGDNRKLAASTGWERRIPFRESIVDIYEEMRQR